MGRFSKNKTFGSDFKKIENTMFEMDFENELACVIHDEVHSICLEDRGHVWESIFMLLPSHVQNLMLSATLDLPENFAKWVENIHKNISG
jgi:superfamily II RNA helicase